MRVTFVLPSVIFTEHSGGFRVHYETAIRLAERGHRVTLVHKAQTWRVWLRGKLMRFTSKPFVLWFQIPESVHMKVLRRVNRRTLPQSDVILFTSWPSTLDWPSVRRLAPGVVLVWDYEFWMEADDMLRARMRAAFAQPGLMLVAGSLAVQAMLEAMQLSAMRVIPPGIDLKTFRQTAGEPLRHDKTVGFLNRPGIRRGIEDLVAASETIRESDAAVRFVAAGSLGDEVPNWMELRPAQTDAALADFYRELAVFVLPSRFEGLGLPALEAMACGTAVVVTDNGGSRQYTRNGENCLVVPVGDSDAMADAVLRLLRDDALRARIASAGATTAATYTWDRATEELERLLAEITV